MTASFACNLLFVFFIVSCSGCKKQSTIDEGTTLKPSSCLIASQTTKELISASQPSTLDPETVTINGESFQVTTTKKSVYTYDTQGRILTEYNQYAGSQAHYAQAKADSVFYQYGPSTIIIHTVMFVDSGKKERTYEVALNNQGFAEKQSTTNLATYDKDGYLTTLRDEYGKNIAKIDNGNIIELEYGNTTIGSIYITKNEYDLSKLGMPSVRAFYGKPSYNLLTRSVIDENTGYVIFPNVHMDTYTYIFDAAGHVMRQITRGKNGEPSFIYGVNTVNTIDYTYICP
jgi:uncharacterized protein YcfL